MNTFWQYFKYRIVGAGSGAILHLVMFVIASLGSEGGGALIIFFVDRPLWILAEWFSLLGDRYYVFLFGVCGTIMYAVLGWCLGLLIEKIKNCEK